VNRTEKQLLSRQLQRAAKGLVTDGVVGLVKGEQAVTLLATQVGKQEQHVAVLVSLSPQVTAVIEDVLDQMFSDSLEGEE
jgi:hypothetical protein